MQDRVSESMVLNGNVEHFVVSHNKVHDNDNIGIDFIGFEGECRPRAGPGAQTRLHRQRRLQHYVVRNQPMERTRSAEDSMRMAARTSSSNETGRPLRYRYRAGQANTKARAPQNNGAQNFVSRSSGEPGNGWICADKGKSVDLCVL